MIKNAVLSAGLALGLACQPASSQPTGNEIVLQGALSPSEVRSSILAVCLGSKFEVSISYDKLGNAELRHFSIDGRSHLGSRSTGVAANILRSLNRPFFSDIKCRDNETISISVSGLDRSLASKNEEIHSFELSSRE